MLAHIAWPLGSTRVFGGPGPDQAGHKKHKERMENAPGGGRPPETPLQPRFLIAMTSTILSATSSFTPRLFWIFSRNFFSSGAT
jgi:hypothetical protein